MPARLHALQRATDQRVKTLPVWPGRALHHGAARLIRVGRREDVLPCLQHHRAEYPRHAALEGAPELAAGDHLLAGVTTLFEVHATDRFVVEHLRHKSLEHRQRDKGHAAEHRTPGPDLGAHGRAFGGGLILGADPEGALLPCITGHGRVQRYRMATRPCHGLPRGGVGHGGAGAVAEQAAQLPLVTRVRQLDLGAQHEHGQAFEGLGQQVLRHDQQHHVGRGLDHDKAGLHAPLGVAEGRQPGLAHGQEQHVVGQLVVQKVGRVFALGLDHPQLGQGAGAIEVAGKFCGEGRGHGVLSRRLAMGLNYHPRLVNMTF